MLCLLLSSEGEHAHVTEITEMLEVMEEKVYAERRLWHAEADVKHRDAQIAELQRQLDEVKRLRELEAAHHYGDVGGSHSDSHWSPGAHHGEDPGHWPGARSPVLH